MIFVEASQIIPNLWQGSFPEPGREVAASGFNLLVLCARESQGHDDDRPFTSEDYCGVRILLAPNRDDGSRLTRKQLDIAIAAGRQVAEAVKAGEKVLVTCQEGINRSGLVNAIALHLLNGWSGTKSVLHIRSTRKHPKGWMALTNLDFVKALEKLSLNEPVVLPPGWVQSPSGLIMPRE